MHPVTHRRKQLCNQPFNRETTMKILTNHTKAPAKRISDYIGISEFFAGIIADAKPYDIKSQLFLVNIETNYNKWGDEMFLSPAQLTWLLNMQP